MAKRIEKGPSAAEIFFAQESPSDLSSPKRYSIVVSPNGLDKYLLGC